MKNLLFVAMLISATLVYGQAFTGKEDTKLQIGLNAQNNATGINASYDYGIGPNISIGLSSSYALSLNDKVLDADFTDRFDLRARFNANIGDVINIGEHIDFYPGISFGLKNFGGHIGARYFFSEGFGIYTEIGAPLAKYKTGVLTPAEKIHNQFTINIGASFHL